MQQLITLKEWCEKNGRNKKCAGKWALEDRIPGAVRVEAPNMRGGFRWMVPEDAMLIAKKIGRPKKDRKAEKEPRVYVPKPRPRPVLPTMHDKCEHIRKHCLTKSYRELKEDTGMSYAEIRRVYERLHERYGI